MVCNRCKKNVESIEMLSSSYGWVCEDCAAELTECYRCKELVEEEEISFYQGAYMCQGCQRDIDLLDTERSLMGEL